MQRHSDALEAEPLRQALALEALQSSASRAASHASALLVVALSALGLLPVVVLDPVPLEQFAPAHAGTAAELMSGPASSSQRVPSKCDTSTPPRIRRCPHHRTLARSARRRRFTSTSARHCRVPALALGVGPSRKEPWKRPPGSSSCSAPSGTPTMTSECPLPILPRAKLSRSGPPTRCRAWTRARLVRFSQEWNDVTTTRCMASSKLRSRAMRLASCSPKNSSDTCGFRVSSPPSPALSDPAAPSPARPSNTLTVPSMSASGKNGAAVLRCQSRKMELTS
mmetsp:Transcript_2923/g.6847  ORF Transcript_2923/g.6847 Transcript_2923/m.6847 type:complete len:281 (-) Transcript_2923:2031-2873(-)